MMGRRWVEDAMDIDKDGSDGVSEETEDHENDRGHQGAQGVYSQSSLSFHHHLHLIL